MKGPGEIFQRPGGFNWLALSGSLPALTGESPRLLEGLLERIDFSKPTICFVMKEPDLKGLMGFLEDLDELLEITIDVVDIQTVTSAEAQQTIAQAGLIILAGGTQETWFEVLERLTIHKGMEDFFQGGGLIFVIGEAAGAMGAWMIQGSEVEPTMGLDWLNNAIILPGIEAPTKIPAVKTLLSQEAHLYALGFPRGAVLALGPDGEIEVWGSTAPAISLGRGWGE